MYSLGFTQRRGKYGDGDGRGRWRSGGDTGIVLEGPRASIRKEVRMLSLAGIRRMRDGFAAQWNGAPSNMYYLPSKCSRAGLIISSGVSTSAMCSRMHSRGERQANFNTACE